MATKITKEFSTRLVGLTWTTKRWITMLNPKQSLNRRPGTSGILFQKIRGLTSLFLTPLLSPVPSFLQSNMEVQPSWPEWWTSEPFWPLHVPVWESLMWEMWPKRTCWPWPSPRRMESASWSHTLAPHGSSRWETGWKRSSRDRVRLQRADQWPLLGYAISPLTVPNWVVKLYAKTGLDKQSAAVVHRLGPELRFDNNKVIIFWFLICSQSKLFYRW